MLDPVGVGEDGAPLLRALVAEPVTSHAASGWYVGQSAPPCTPDPVAARAARLEARLAVYAQYGLVIAEEAAAFVKGDEARRAALTTEREATAEHFAELCDVAAIDAYGTSAFADALTDALHELRHQDAVDEVLERRLRGLRHAATAREITPTLAAGTSRTPRLDLRF